MPFGSDTWDENDNTDALNEALFGKQQKKAKTNDSSDKPIKKSGKQIDKETREANEFLKNFKAVKKTQKIVQFDVSNESDDENDLSKKAKKNLKERNRKKRKKELEKQERIKKRKENRDSDEELFAEIDEEQEPKQKKIQKQEKSPDSQKASKLKNSKKAEIAPKKKKSKKKKVTEDKELELEKEIEEPKLKVENPFQCVTEEKLSKKKKKKLKKKENQQKLESENKTEKIVLANEGKKNVKKTKDDTNKTSETRPISIKNDNLSAKSKILTRDTEFEINDNESIVKKLTKNKSQDMKDVNKNSVSDTAKSEKNNHNAQINTKKNKQTSHKSQMKNENSDSLEIITKNKKKRKHKDNKNETASAEKKPKFDGSDNKSVSKNTNTPVTPTATKSKFNVKKLADMLGNKGGYIRTPVKNLDSKKEAKSAKVEVPKPIPTLKDRMKNQLNEARFRYLNEQLYTQSGPGAFSMFQDDQESFQVYHEGFQSQVSKWPVNPLDIFIKQIKKLPENYIIADLGCGNADLAQSVSHKVHSFDMVPLNKFVTVCDISKLPLSTKSIDVAIFCLSLMGTNLNDYIAEANRVLKPGGELKIAEVESRITNTDQFIKQIESFGFKLSEKMNTERNCLQDISHKMFHLFYFHKVKPCIKSAIQDVHLQPCIYKRR